MTGARRRSAALVVVVAAALSMSGVAGQRRFPIPSTGRQEGEVRLLIPAFAGPQPLGQKVATVINLQIWQTLRKAPFPNPRGLDFGRGTVVWDRSPLAEQSFEGAERLAASNRAQIVLWGKAWTYGDGVVAQTYLSLPETIDDDGQALWRVELEVGGEPVRFEVGFPRRRYEFAPIVLKPDVVRQFSLPTALKIFKEKGGGEELGELGPIYRARRHEGDWALVKSGNLPPGWIHLPRLSSERSEVVDFAGAAMRLMRGDWDGAHDLLQRVIDNSHTPASIRIDALVLQGVASERLGRNGWPEIAAAYEINRHSRTTATYGLMNRVAELARARERGGGAVDGATDMLKHALKTTRHLFPEDDPWVVDVDRVLASSR